MTSIIRKDEHVELRWVDPRGDHHRVTVRPTDGGKQRSAFWMRDSPDDEWTRMGEHDASDVRLGRTTVATSGEC